jgi:putative peptide zinc metalloprotease protein
VLPFAFVDRTDAYRLRSRVHRLALALAGPLADGVAMGVTAALVLTAPPRIAALAAYLLAVQVLAMLMNLNPLLAGDGYSGLEAGFGLVDPRGRSFAVLVHRIRRRPLPPHLATIGFWARAGYLGYALMCLGYLIFAALILVSVFG